MENLDHLGLRIEKQKGISKYNEKDNCKIENELANAEKHTLKTAATKVFKRVFFATQEKMILKISSQRTKKNKKFHRTVQTRTDTDLNVNRLEQTVMSSNDTTTYEQKNYL